MLAVDHDVGRAADPCDAVDGKAHPLVDSEPCVDEGDWDDHRIDYRRRQEVEEAALTDKRGNALFEACVCETHLAFEADATGDHTIPPLVTRVVQFMFDLALEFRDAYQQILDARRHTRSSCRVTFGWGGGQYGREAQNATVLELERRAIEHEAEPSPPLGSRRRDAGGHYRRVR
jgi:hypothetical protein